MKKQVLVIASALALVITGAQAQTTSSTTTTTTTTTMSNSSGRAFHVQIRAGANFQNLNGKIAGADADGDLLTSFHAGIEVPIMIAPEFYIQPGALFSMKGSKDKDDSDVKTKISYIEVPLNFVYRPMLGNGNIILGVGPYMGIGIGGKVEDGDDETDIKFENEVTPLDYATAPYFRRLDFGGNLLAGYQFMNGLFFQLNAQLGMTNVLPEIQGTDKDDFKLKNTGFGVSLGYMF